MTEQNKCLHRCSFTGHRPEKLSVSQTEIKKLLKIAIKQAIKDGYTTFISGMARGTDIWAAELILKEKKNDNQIKLICVLPYEGFERRWNFFEKKKYHDIIKKADFVKYVCEHYSKNCFQLRNIYMVDRSNRIIAAYNGKRGGTENTINYAKQKTLKLSTF